MLLLLSLVLRLSVNSIQRVLLQYILSLQVGNSEAGEKLFVACLTVASQFFYAKRFAARLS
jgi:hypothetical protein